jgi:hypothetical protein
MFWKRARRMDALNARCRAYLEKGPPLHMTNYVPGSATEIIIAHGAQGKHLDGELSDAAAIILVEAEDLIGIEDPEIRAYMLQGATLVREILSVHGHRA